MAKKLETEVSKVTIPAYLPNLSEEETQHIEKLLARFGNARRRAYNQIKKGGTPWEIIKMIRKETGLRTRYSTDAYHSIKDLPDRVTFGEKKNQKLREKGKITKEEFHRKRNCILISRGDSYAKGNLNLRVVEKKGKLRLRINVGFRKWIYPTLFIPKKYLKRFGHLLDGSKSYCVQITRKDGYSKDYVVRITVSPEVDLEERNRTMALDINSGHIDWAVIDKEDRGLVETGRIDCYELLDASSNKTENFLHSIVDKIGNIAEHYNAEVIGGKLNTGKFSGYSKTNRRIKNMSQYKLRKILGYKLPLRGIPYRNMSEAYTTILGQYLARPLGLDIHKASAYSFGIKILDYEGFKNLQGFLSDYGDGIRREGKNGGCEPTALVQLLAKGYDSVWAMMKNMEATPQKPVRGGSERILKPDSTEV